MSVAQANRSGIQGGPPASRPIRRSRRPRFWRNFLALTLTLLVAGSVAVFVVAHDYQPLSYGETGNPAGAFPDLSTGNGVHLVNTLGGVHQDIYVPPQRGTFSLFVDIVNNGGRAVVIEAIKLSGPGQSASPLKTAGPVLYARAAAAGNAVAGDSLTSHVLHDVTLAPGQAIFVGIPVRSSPCASKSIWTNVPAFFVTEKFLFFTRQVAIAWGPQSAQLVMHLPGGQAGEADTLCVSH